MIRKGQIKDTEQGDIMRKISLHQPNLWNCRVIKGSIIRGILASTIFCNRVRWLVQTTKQQVTETCGPLLVSVFLAHESARPKRPAA